MSHLCATMSTDPRSRAWVEVNPLALCRNLERIREAVGRGVRVAPLVKADAYGVGLEAAVGALEPAGPWGYGVATVPEGIRVRATGVTRPVLVLSPAPPGVAGDAVASRLTLCVSDLQSVRELVEAADRLGTDAAFHLEVDTGMGRSGFDWRSVAEWGPEVEKLAHGHVRWEGMFTHFHSADEPDPGSLGVQGARFDGVVKALGGLGGSGRLLHLSNSAAALRRPDLARALVRPGIFLYGGRAGHGLPTPEPVVAVRARVVLVRDVPGGTTLGYGATYSSSRVERWATVGIGYGDGLPRALGNRGAALVAGVRVPIIGRISMDLTVVDITDLPSRRIEVGTEVTLIGADGGEQISLDEVAADAGTISYEILTGLTSRLPRILAEPIPGEGG